MSTRRKLAFAAGAILLLIAGFLFGFRWYLIRRVANLRSELKAKGERLTVQELIANRRIPETNGALDLLRALSQLPFIPPNDPVFESYVAMRPASPGRAIVGWKQPDLRTPTAARTNHWSGLQTELIDMGAVFDQISAAVRKPAFEFNLDYSQPFFAGVASLPLTQLKSAARLLAARTEVYLHNETPESALESIRDQLAMASVLRDEPLLIAQLLRDALGTYALFGTWEALQADGWSDNELNQLQMSWQDQEFLESFSRALVMERAMTEGLFNAVRDSSGSINQLIGAPTSASPNSPVEATVETAQTIWNGTTGVLWTWFLSYNDEYAFLRTSQDAIEQQRAGVAGRSYKIAHEGLSSSLQRQPPGLGSVLAQLMISSWSNSLSRPFLAQTEREMAMTAIALKRYSLSHSKLPSRLDELIPEFLSGVPVDFVDGQPLRYRVNTNGTFLLYSIGKNLRDDNGDPTSLEPNGKGFSAGRDLVWPTAAGAEETARYNESVGNQMRKRFDQKARRDASRRDRSPPAQE